jgi:hypothetical protein
VENAPNNIALFLVLKQFNIIEAFRLPLLHISFIWVEKDNSCENLTPRSKTSPTLTNRIEFTE